MTANTGKAWSSQQLAIFSWFLALVAGLGRNLVVRARAGTGKTTTIIEAIRRLSAAKPSLSVCLCAFNKRIAEELTARLGGLPNAQAKTLHSLGFACVLPAWKGVKVDSGRGRKLALRACGDAPAAVYRAVAKLASLAKNMRPLDYSIAVMLEIGAQFEVFPTDPDECGEEWTDEEIARAAVRAVDLAKERDGSVDFDDMLFVPLALNLTRAKFDVLVVDEAQDMNAAQLLLARRLVRKAGSVVVVGDDRQAIYAFRGADSSALDRLKAELVAEELPLTVTYRCGRAIVALAQQLVPDFEAGAGNAEGTVSSLAIDRLLAEVRPGNFVLSRKNAPLMGLCLSLLKQGVRAKIVGRDIGETLVVLVRKLDRDGTVDSLLTAIDRWEAKELQLAQRADSETRAQEAADKADVLRTLAEDSDTVAQVLSKIDALFADLVAGQPIQSVVLSSVHKAKGLEADKVFVLVDTLYPGKGGQDSIEERNIHYVAVTRAKHELVQVNG